MKKLYTALVLALFSTGAFAQTFTKLAGTSAGIPGGHPGVSEVTTATYKEFQLTTNAPIEQKAAVWRDGAFSLTGNWSFQAELNFGPWSETNPDPSKVPAYNSGADGIAFVLATAQYLGQWGEEVGYGTRNVTAGTYVPNNSLAFEMDTWENTTTGFNGAHGYLNHNEPGDGNHAAFMGNGNTIHNAGVFPALGVKKTIGADLENAGWIPVTISWTDNPAAGQGGTLNITSAFSNLTSSITLTDAQLTSLFGSANPSLFLGFTAATGSAANNHRIRWFLDPPPPPPACGQLRTQTQGGWGQECKDLTKNNPGCYMARNFAAAFPTGVRIGSTAPGGRSLLFTSSDAVAEFLPSGGPNKTLAQLGLPVGTTTDPSGATAATGRSNINGQLLALSVSVGFDNWDASFGPAPIKLQDMIIGSGPYAGQTVGAFLAFANSYIGGGGTDADIISDIHETAGNINENYVDGTVDKGYLVCPTAMRAMPVAQTMATIEDIALPATNAATVYPNPSRGLLNVNLAKLPAGAEIQVVNSRGAIVARKLAGGAQSLSFDVHQYGSGVYMIKVISEGKVQTLKALVQE